MASRSTASSCRRLLTRRSLLAASGLLAVAGSRTAFAGDGTDGATPRLIQTPSRQDDERHLLVRGVAPTSLTAEPALANPRIRPNAPIAGVRFNPDLELFEGLDPAHPQDRTDLAFAMMAAALDVNQSLFAGIPERLSSRELDATPIGQLALAVTPPPFPSDDQMAAFLDKLRDPVFSVPVWHKRNGFHLARFKPGKGLRVNLMASPNGMSGIFYGNSSQMTVGFRAHVEDERLNIDLYQDDFEYPDWSDSEIQAATNKTYSYLLYQGFENIVLFAGRADILETYQ